MSKSVHEVSKPVKVDVYECNQCGRTDECVPRSTYGISTTGESPLRLSGGPPKNWFWIGKEGHFSSDYHWDFCSWECVERFAQRERIETAAGASS